MNYDNFKDIGIIFLIMSFELINLVRFIHDQLHIESFNKSARLF